MVIFKIGISDDGKTDCDILLYHYNVSIRGIKELLRGYGGFIRGVAGGYSEVIRGIITVFLQLLLYF